MFVFQTIHRRSPLQDYVETFFGWLGGLAADHVQIGWLSAFLSQAVIGGVGSVFMFVPQIALLFVLTPCSRAPAICPRGVSDGRVMARAGLEGRAFVGAAVVVRLRDSQDHGDQVVAVGEGPVGHHDRCAADDLFGPAAGLHPTGESAAARRKRGWGCSAPEAW